MGSTGEPHTNFARYFTQTHASPVREGLFGRAFVVFNIRSVSIRAFLWKIKAKLVRGLYFATTTCVDEIQKRRGQIDAPCISEFF